MGHENIGYIIDGRDIYPCYRITADNGRGKALNVNEASSWSVGRGYANSMDSAIQSIDDLFGRRYPSINSIRNYIRKGFLFVKYSTKESHFEYCDIEQTHLPKVESDGYECSILVNPQEYRYHLEFFKDSRFSHLLKGESCKVTDENYLEAKTYDITIYDLITLDYSWESNDITYEHRDISKSFRIKETYPFGDNRIEGVQEYWRMYNGIVKAHASDLIEHLL